VTRTPLMIARARYHVGDALLFRGRPEEAAARLDESLRTAEIEGSAEELARIRARRAAAMRLLGRYDDAARDLEHATDQAPDSFSRQRVAQEASALEAARGHGWEALRLAIDADRFFGRTHERPDEARFRRRFARFRLAVAQRTLETGDPYRPPFRPMTAPQAAATLRGLVNDLSNGRGSAHREAALRLDALILLATCVPPESALPLLNAIREDPGPVHACATTIATAHALATAGQPEDALATFAGMPGLPPDPGLRAWAAAACAETLLRLGRTDEAVAVIDEASGLPEAFREQIGRAWGTALMAADTDRRCPHWALATGPLPLPDTLALAFSRLPAPRSGPPCATAGFTDQDHGRHRSVRRSPSPAKEPPPGG